MESPKLSPAHPVPRLTVAAQAWFYMNHLHGPRDAAPHDHNYLELAFVVRGRSSHYFVAGEETSRSGDVYVIPVGAWHGYAGSHTLEIINCLLSPSLLDRELAWIHDDPVFQELFCHRGPQGLAGVRRLHASPARFRHILALLADLEKAYAEERPRPEILGRLLLVLSAVRDLAETSGLHRREISVAHPAIRRALEILHRDLSQDWTLPEISRRLNLNPSYFIRLFRSQTGVSPMKYLAQVRAERAATLLLTNRRPVAEIGEEVGWPDPKKFARNFREHFGSSASAYRERMQKPDKRTDPPALEQRHFRKRGALL